MLRTQFNSALAALAALLTVQQLVSCGPKNAAKTALSPAAVPAGPLAPQPPATPAQAGTSRVDGTSDTGGGTGLNLKVFESYIVKDITALPEFKKYVQPILENLEKDRPKADFSWSIARLKTWYIAPVDLSKIDKATLGVSFMTTETQQFARQSKRQIWIDQRLWDAMKEKDRGDLLVHEVVMAMYLLRFWSIEELCDMSKVLHPLEPVNCGKLPEYFKDKFTAEKERPLTEEDNERIQFVTGWLLQNASDPEALRNFDKVAEAKGFDKRFFNQLNKGATASQTTSEPKLSYASALQAIKSSNVAGYIPQNCTIPSAEGGSKTVPCKVELSTEIIPFGATHIEGLNVKISVDGKEIASMKGVLSNAEGTDATVNNFTNQSVYVLAITETRGEPKVGDHFYQGVVILSPTGPGKALMVQSLSLFPGLITEVTTTLENGNYCRTLAPKATNTFADGVIAHDAAVTDLLFEYVIFNSQRFVHCMPSAIHVTH
jgi:hypothetical protein